MAYMDLREFITVLEDNGELKRISAAVDRNALSHMAALLSRSRSSA